MALSRQTLRDQDRHGNEFKPNSSISKQSADASQLRPTKLSRFRQKINDFFNWGEPQVALPVINTNDLEKEIKKNLEELHTVNHKLEKNSDPNFYHVREKIIVPLIKEFERFQNNLFASYPSENHKAFQKYSIWMEKSKLWIEICTNPPKTEDLCRAIIQHNNEEFKHLINHDLQIIQDYLTSSLDATHLEEQEKRRLEERLQQQLQHHLKLLEELKTCPLSMDLENLVHWREKVNSLREVYFGTALHAIDLGMQEVKAPYIIEDEGDHHIEIIRRLTKLETKISNIAGQIPKLDQGDEKRIHLMESQFSHLEDEVHDLNSDLRLSQDHVDRLQSLSHRLSNIRQKLNP